MEIRLVTGLGSVVGSEGQPRTNRRGQAALLGALSLISFVTRRRDDPDLFICSFSGAW